MTAGHHNLNGLHSRKMCSTHGRLDCVEEREGMAEEKNFENRVKKFLKDQGCWFIKYWGGAAYTKSGIPDLLVCCNGNFLGVELKGPKGEPSDLQLCKLREIEKAGGYAILLFPDDFQVFKDFIIGLNYGFTEAKIASRTYTYLLKPRWKHFENKRKGE